MSKQQLIRINTPDKATQPLSKPQKEFNRLTKKIGELETDIAAFRRAATTIQQRVASEYEPLLLEYNLLRSKLVYAFDQAHDRPGTTKTEKKKLVDLILTISYELIDQHGFDELKPVFDKYDSEGFDSIMTDADQEVSEVMKQMVTSMFGIQFDENVDVSTPEKFTAYVEEQMHTKQQEVEEKNRISAEKRAAKPKTAKQQEREAKKELELRNITKAVRTLYMDLVKTFHPDREPDEAEKARKTEIMQRVTEAYEKSDLLALLRLQLEFNRIDQTHLENLADEQLKYYNKILRQQVEELEQESFSLQQQMATISGRPGIFRGSAISLEFSFNNDLAELKTNTKALKNDLKALNDPAEMKAFLKSYRIPKRDDYGPADLMNGFL